MTVNCTEKAEILIQALPYIQRYNKKIVVIKYGGNAMINDELKEAVMRDLVLLAQVGVKVVLVHGGGPEISDTLNKMHIESHFVNGLRKTDSESISVVQMVLAGKVNKSLVNLIENAGGRAIGLSGIDGHMLEVVKLSEDLGYVGEVTRVDPSPIIDMLDKGYIPVISTLGYDKHGDIYNINADTAAAKIAGALSATSLISMTDIRGILRDPKDDSTLIPTVKLADTKNLINGGIISGGMIPKVQSCIIALQEGVEKVFIIDGRVPHSILVEVLSDEGIGTMFVK